MTVRLIAESLWPPLSEFVARRMGLHFPPERRDDLQRGLAAAAQEFGLPDAAACADFLLAGPPNESQIQVLASHLTIGETYFFRDPQMLDALAGTVLPELIRLRRGREQRLRIWSAGCCTGEEPYTLAILLHEALPDLSEWQVTITATDINPRFLHKAAAGVYGEWSFRNAPAGLKERYFQRTAEGRYAIAPRIRQLVDFSHLNLARDAYPSLATGTNAMDIIFCRNVLMYFALPQARTVIGNLNHALVEGGWLAVSPSEVSQSVFPEFTTVNFPGAIFYRKTAAPPAVEPWWMLPPVEVPGDAVSSEARPPEEPSLPPAAVAEQLYQEGRYAEAVNRLEPPLTHHARGPRAFSVLARAQANLGRLDEALSWCERWIAADKLDPAGHYLRAVVLLERGQPEPARASLQRALYLAPDFVLAHFALGNLARSRGMAGEAERHFVNAMHLLGRHRPEDILLESDGLTAGRLTETITSITSAEASP